MESLVIVHPWQDRGIGQAPFAVVCCISMPSAEAFGANVGGYANAMAEAQHAAKQHGISLGSCDVCGTGIHNHFVIRDAAGKKFACGCDCVQKAGDHRLMSGVKNIQRLAAKAKREAARAAKWEAAKAARLAADAIEREQNGGLTNHELAEQKRAAERKAAEEQMKVRNWWLIEVIQGMSGDFCQNMADELCKRSFGSLSPRCQSILRDIYGKSFGRSGSKKYDAAVEDFDQRTEG